MDSKKTITILVLAVFLFSVVGTWVVLNNHPKVTIEEGPGFGQVQFQHDGKNIQYAPDNEGAEVRFKNG